MAELRQRKPSTSGTNGVSKETNGSSKKTQNGAAKKSGGGISESMNKLLGLVVLAMTLGLLFRENINHFITNSLLGGKPPRLPADIARRDAIVDAFKHAYNAYETHAFGSDVYHPLTQKGSNLTSSGGIGAFIASSLPTIQIMGLSPEYSRARSWMEKNLEWEGKNGDVNAYQVTSQVLGGLLSSYALTGDRMYLEKAEDLAGRLEPIFDADSPFGIPQSKVNLGKREAVVDENHIAVTNEAMGVQVEWWYLAELLMRGEGGGGDAKGREKGKEWREKVDKVVKRIKENPLASGQASLFIAIEAGKFMTSQTRIGYRGDNFYSYLLKQHLQSCPSSSSSPPTQSIYAEMYQTYIETVQDTLIGKSLGKGLTYIKELTPKAGRRGYMNWYTVPKQDQISCFLGGTLLLGSQTPGVGLNSTSGEMTERGKKDWEMGKELIETCVDFWRGTKTGLAPEVVKFRTPDDGLGAHGGKSDWFIETSPSSATTPHPPASYQLRSETIESLFYAWRLTGDERYREYGWEIFESIEKYTKVEEGGYASLSNVENGKSRKEDRMESYFLSETLKYLYLLFADSDTIPLERYVFTSHGQPLPKLGEGCRK